MDYDFDYFRDIGQPCFVLCRVSMNITVTLPELRQQNYVVLNSLNCHPTLPQNTFLCITFTLTLSQLRSISVTDWSVESVE